MMGRYSTLEEAVAAYPRERTPEDGHSTCLWHRQHEHYTEHILPLLPKCYICGGKMDPRAARHELCRARAAHGLPTPRLDATRECPCAKCRPARGRDS